LVSYATIGMVLGMSALGTGLLLGLAGALPRVLVAVGIASTTMAFIAAAPTIPPSPTPRPIPNPFGPTPTPLPTPPAPQPVTPFGQLLVAAFQAEGGTAKQAAELAALHLKMADIIEYDGRQQAPLLKNTSDMGQSFALLQQYYFLSNPTPLANLFPRMESAIAAEAAKREIISSASLPLDAARRAAAAQLYREIGSALARTGE
jgi:hypothetical protein